MKKNYLFIVLLALMGWSGTMLAQTTLPVQLSTDSEAHYYQIQSNNAQTKWLSSSTFPAATEADRGMFQFFDAGDGFVYIKEAGSGKWLRYKDTGEGGEKIELVDSKDATNNKWNVCYVEGSANPCYIMPSTNDNRTFNYNGTYNVGENSLKSIGFYRKDNGGKWNLVEVTENVESKILSAGSTYWTLVLNAETSELSSILARDAEMIGAPELSLVEELRTLKAEYDAAEVKTGEMVNNLVSKVNQYKTTTQLYLPTGYYYFRSVAVPGTQYRDKPYLFNNSLLANNSKCHTLQSVAKVETNNGIWHVTNNNNGTITVVNGDGKGVGQGNANQTGAQGNVTMRNTYTFGSFNSSNFTSWGNKGIYFTEALNASNEDRFSVNSSPETRYVTTWQNMPNERENNWDFEPVSVDGLNVYTVVVTGAAAGYVKLTATNEIAYNGGFFLRSTEITRDDLESAEIAGNNAFIQVNNENKTIELNYSEQTPYMQAFTEAYQLYYSEQVIGAPNQAAKDRILQPAIQSTIDPTKTEDEKLQILTAALTAYKSTPATDIYFPSGNYYMKNQASGMGYAYNDYDRESNPNHYTMLTQTAGANNTIWKVTNNGNGTITIANGEGTSLNKAGTKYTTLTMGAYNHRYFTQFGGIYFTAGLHATPQTTAQLSDGTYYLINWTHDDNGGSRWSFEPVEDTLYDLVVENGDANTVVSYNGEKAFNGGFFKAGETPTAANVTASGYEIEGAMQFKSFGGNTITVTRNEGKYLVDQYDKTKDKGLFTPNPEKFDVAINELRANPDELDKQAAVRALFDNVANYFLPTTGRYFIQNKGTKRYLTNYGNPMNVITPTYYSIWDITVNETDGTFTMFNEGAAYAERPFFGETETDDKFEKAGKAFLTWNGTQGNHAFAMDIDPTYDSNNVVVQPTGEDLAKATLKFEIAGDGWFKFRSNNPDATGYGFITSNDSYHGTDHGVNTGGSKDQTLNYGNLVEGSWNGFWKLYKVSEGAKVYNLLNENGTWITNHSTLGDDRITTFTEEDLFKLDARENNVYYVGGPVTLKESEIAYVEALKTLNDKINDGISQLQQEDAFSAGAHNAKAYAEIIKDTKALKGGDTDDYYLDLSTDKKFYLESLDRPNYGARLASNGQGYTAYLGRDDKDQTVQWTLDEAVGGFYLKNVSTGKYMSKTLGQADAPEDGTQGNRIIVNVKEVVPGIYFIYNVDKEKANQNDKYLTLNGSNGIVHYNVLELSTLWKIKSINSIEVKKPGTAYGPTKTNVPTSEEGKTVTVENPFWYDFYTADQESPNVNEVRVTTYCSPMSTYINDDDHMIPYYVTGTDLSASGELRVNIKQVKKINEKFHLCRGTGYILVRPTDIEGESDWEDDMLVLSNFPELTGQDKTDFDNNLLTPAMSEVHVNNDNFKDIYVLNFLEATGNVGHWDGQKVYGHGFGFYHLNRGKTISAGKAYLHASVFAKFKYNPETKQWENADATSEVRAERGAAAAAELSEEAIANQYALLQIVDDFGNVTGIIKPNAQAQGGAVMYDLSGRRVNEAKPGTITIQQGKKIFKR